MRVLLSQFHGCSAHFPFLTRVFLLATLLSHFLFFCFHWGSLWVSSSLFSYSLPTWIVFSILEVLFHDVIWFHLIEHRLPQSPSRCTLKKHPYMWKVHYPFHLLYHLRNVWILQSTLAYFDLPYSNQVQYPNFISWENSSALVPLFLEGWTHGDK